MKLNKLANAILRHSWLIDPRYAEGMMPRVVAFLSGNKSAIDFSSDQEIESPSPSCLLPSGDIQNNFNNVPKGSIAIISIEGSIMKDDFCGEAGTETMGKWLKEAYANENIAGVLLKINSGGGTVEGTGEFAQIIENRNKPVVAFCDGLMASAAYWIGSSCDEVILSFETVEVGSIGTMINFYDNREALNMRGYQSHYINADSSPDKNQDYFKAIEGDYTPIKTNILNPTNDVFLSAVRRNRADKLIEFGDGDYKEPLTGKIYLAKRSIEIGLVDSIGDMDYALNRINELSESKEFTNNHTNMLGNKFKKISALKNKKADEITEEDINAANAELQSEGVIAVSLVSETVIEQANTNADNLQTANDKLVELQAQVDTLTVDKTKLNNDLADANKKVSELGKLPGATTTTAVKETEEIVDDPGANDEESFYSEADAELAVIRKNSKKVGK